jgi:hypothetical protein
MMVSLNPDTQEDTMVTASWESSTNASTTTQADSVDPNLIRVVLATLVVIVSIVLRVLNAKLTHVMQTSKMLLNKILYGLLVLAVGQLIQSLPKVVWSRYMAYSCILGTCLSTTATMAVGFMLTVFVYHNYLAIRDLNLTRTPLGDTAACGSIIVCWVIALVVGFYSTKSFDVRDPGTFSSACHPQPTGYINSTVIVCVCLHACSSAVSTCLLVATYFPYRKQARAVADVALQSYQRLKATWIKRERRHCILVLFLVIIDIHGNGFMYYSSLKWQQCTESGKQGGSGQQCAPSTDTVEYTMLAIPVQAIIFLVAYIVAIRDYCNISLQACGCNVSATQEEASNVQAVNYLFSITNGALNRRHNEMSGENPSRPVQPVWELELVQKQPKNYCPQELTTTSSG